MADITPLSQITVTVTKAPTNAAAVKTIVRILSKDRIIAGHNRRQERIRKAGFRQNQRGGRFWDVHVVKQHPVLGKPGDTGTILATLDVITDLKSVEKWVEVKPA